jgi:hypothetical protein
MKGMVFTELMDMVEASFGETVLEEMIDGAQLSHGGSYTAVGSYPHEEIVRLVISLSKQVHVPVPDLVKAFGVHLFGRFTEAYGRFFKDAKNAFDFLSGVESYIHVEVLKLYPDAELPSFDVHQANEHTLIMVYRSKRGFGDLAEGLIMGAIKHFNESISLERQSIHDEKGEAIVFTLTRLT